MCDVIATRLDSVLCTCKSLREFGAAYGLASEAKPNRVIVALEDFRIGMRNSIATCRARLLSY